MGDLFLTIICSVNGRRNLMNESSVVCPVKTRNLSMYTMFICYDYEKQLMDCRIVVENVDEVGVVNSKRYISFDFSWLTIAQIQELINAVGFRFDDLLGEFIWK